MTTIAIIGLGEAGRLYAAGLAAAGATVHSYDPYTRLDETWLTQHDTLAEAVAGADAVLSLVGAGAAAAVADQALPLLGAGTVYADLNTGSSELKRGIAASARACGAAMADVAVLAPVPRAGSATPLLASGDGAAALATVLRPLGVPIEVLDAEAGAAARLKLLRSVFMKGLAALIIEGLTAARAGGDEPWLRAQIASELGPDGPALVERLVSGTFQHAARREHEMADVIAELEHSGSASELSRATRWWLARIAAGEVEPL